MQRKFFVRAAAIPAAIIVLGLVLGLFVSVAISSAWAQSPSLSGTWKGRYFYNNNRTAVDFTLDLDGANGRCIGHVKEINTFGEKSAPSLYANVSCPTAAIPPGGEFRFHKQYDGTGGVSHGVDYDGVVSADGNTIAGKWTIITAKSRATGQFSMTRGQ